jgi:hypothetical protein
LAHHPRLGVAASSALVLEMTGVDGGLFSGAEEALSELKAAGSRMVDRRRGVSCAGAGAAFVSNCVAGRSSIGGANSGVLS